MRSYSAFGCAAILVLTACNPPAADEQSRRVRIADTPGGPSTPIDSPDSEGAGWAESAQADRIIYGKPGEAPLFALSCTNADGPSIRLERMAPADPQAQGVLALIGNSHVARIFVDAVEVGETWRWLGSVPADDPGLEGLSGRGRVEATVPGGGTLVLNPSQLPGNLIARCAARIEPDAPQALEEDPA